MKWLIGLSAVQTFLLAVLGLRVMAVDARTVELTEAAVAAQQASKSDTDREESQWAWPSNTDGNAGITADEIRSIFREELAALEEKVGAIDVTAHAPHADAPASRITREEARRLKASYDQDLSYYRSRGAITDKEMADLQMKIAQLPQAERRAALSDLAKAISSGDIDGRM